MNNREQAREELLAVGGIESDDSDGGIEEIDLEFCDACGDEFNYDDCGGYRPPCKCGLNCRSCCEHGRCEREDRDDEDGGSDVD